MLSFDLNPVGFSWVAGALLLLTCCGRVLYNLYLHPLKDFPGPLLHRATVLPYVYKGMRGRLTIDVLGMTDKYGPIVRVAPNELAFIDPEAWKDIYSHRNGSITGDEFAKNPLWYRAKGFTVSILGETRDNHALLRRQLSHGFSDKAMRQQEPIIGGYVDLLMKRFREHCYWTEGPKRGTPKLLDLRAWYNWATFDIIGDLAFGESFGSLERAEQDPWVTNIMKTLTRNRYFNPLRYVGLESVIMALLKQAREYRVESEQLTTAKLRRRMALTTERPDLIEGLLRKNDTGDIDFPHLRANAGLLIIAGSETTATLLCGVTYLLLKNPNILARLAEEVRTAFKSEDEITLLSVSSLTYMLACLNEALRYYPPVGGEMPRIVPQGGANIAGKFVPENTIAAVWQWPMYHSARNFSDSFSFKPERFLEPEKFPDDKFDVLQPFSVGPRNCIGKNLAYAEMRLILARLIFNFDMKLVDTEMDWFNQRVYFLWDKPALNVHLIPVRA